MAGRQTKPETTKNKHKKANKDQDINDTTKGVEPNICSDKLPTLGMDDTTEEGDGTGKEIESDEKKASSLVEDSCLGG